MNNEDRVKLLKNMITARDELTCDLDRLQRLELGLSIQTYRAIQDTIYKLNDEIVRVKRCIYS